MIRPTYNICINILILDFFFENSCERTLQRYRSSRGQVGGHRKAFHCSDNNSINATTRKHEEEHEKEANKDEEAEEEAEEEEEYEEEKEKEDEKEQEKEDKDVGGAGGGAQRLPSCSSASADPFQARRCLVHVCLSIARPKKILPFSEENPLPFPKKTPPPFGRRSPLTYPSPTLLLFELGS